MGFSLCESTTLFHYNVLKSDIQDQICEENKQKRQNAQMSG
jgi:hypothetical protein